jgi:cytoskeleton protein RodZ
LPAILSCGKPVYFVIFLQDNKYLIHVIQAEWLSVMEKFESKFSRDVLADIGAVIADERRRRGLTMAMVSEHLRVPKRYLIYIETGNLEKLPAMTYVIGYVRSYARLLDLDDVKFCADLKSSMVGAKPELGLKFTKSRINGGNNAGRVALATVVAAVLAYGGWYSFSVISTPSTEVVSGVVEDEGTESVSESSAPDVTVEENAVSEPDGTAAESIPSLALVDSAQNSPKVTDALAVNRYKDDEILLEITANSWIDITRTDGSSVISRLMFDGDTYRISDDGLYLTTGNAGGVNIRVGKADPITLGASGEVLRELPLNQAAIAERY